MSTSRRALLGASAALAAGSAINIAAIIAKPQAAEPSVNLPKVDPIFALIERHRAAVAACNAYNSDSEAHDDKHCRQLCDDEIESRLDLLDTPPVSLAGCIAVLRYIGEFAATDNSGLFNDWSDDISDAGADFLGVIADALEATQVSA